MSRRRPAPPPLAAGATRQFTLKVVCGCRGAYPDQADELLYHLADMRSREYSQAFMVLDGRNGSPVSAWREDSTVRYQFRCTRCREYRPLREENLITIYDRLTAAEGCAGHPVLDISALTGIRFPARYNNA